LKKNKIFILLPDGIGLRNFAYTNFHEIGIESNHEIIYWNSTPFNLSELGFDEIKIQNPKPHPFTEIYKNARKEIELNQNKKRLNDAVFESYKFPQTYRTVKLTLKSIATQLLSKLYSSKKGLIKVRKKINKLESSTSYYKTCLNTLEQEKPDFVFCTNQRPLTGIAPILAAKKLGIPTGTFIFSWDNLPKATLVLETDFYFVWSDFMKKELQFYYPYIKENQILVTGTPQFENHFKKNNILSREAFFAENNLDVNKKYICYSGDDITTCPDDPQYLDDVALSVKKLNEKGHNLGVIFRPCPVDFSNRFDEVLKKNQDTIVTIRPKWKKAGNDWNTILPTKADIFLQTNTIAHTEMVVNLGSSMVFDYAAHDKPCAFINYDVKNKVLKDWSVKKIYNYIHFRSMPTRKSVVWINNPDEIAGKIEESLTNSEVLVENAKDWFKIINKPIPEMASFRIWDDINNIIK
jgi:hypothetical protein